MRGVHKTANSAPGLVGEAVALHEDELTVRARLEHIPGAQGIPAHIPLSPLSYDSCSTLLQEEHA